MLAFRVWSYKQGELVSLMIHLGDRLGLYRALDGAGPTDADQLARRTDMHPRWLLEWLRGQAAAGLLETEDGNTFELTAEGSAVLADEEESLLFAAGAFQGGVAPPEVVDRLAEAFSTGIGLTYEDLGASAAHAVERMLAPWSRLALVPELLPRLDGVVTKLEEGIAVADVGCGAGTAIMALASAYPSSRFEGWDPSQQAVHRARTIAEERSLANVSFHVAEAAELHQQPTFDLVLTFDCLHDMTRPEQAAVAVRRALHGDGTWLIKEVKAGESWEDNQRNPVLAMMYATSVATCMSSAMSEPGGAGLGTLGLPEGRLARDVSDGRFHGWLRGSRHRRPGQPLLRGPSLGLADLHARSAAQRRRVRTSPTVARTNAMATNAAPPKAPRSTRERTSVLSDATVASCAPPAFRSSSARSSGPSGTTTLMLSVAAPGSDAPTAASSSAVLPSGNPPSSAVRSSSENSDRSPDTSAVTDAR